MEALGQLSPLSYVEAQIQSYVAKFLGLKSEILKYTNHPLLSIRSEASAFYVRQQGLEKELQDVLGNISKFKEGAWTFSDIGNLTDFADRLRKHISEVKSFLDRAKGQESAVSVSIPGGFGAWTVSIVGSIIGGLFLIWAFRTGRSLK